MAHEEPLLRDDPSHEPFSIVVPVYDEASALEQTVGELAALVAMRPGAEVVFVDDGSRDGSGDLLRRLTAGRDGFVVVAHARNRGYGAALKTGLRRAKNELVVITDADGTYPNARIPELVDACRDRDMVVGARTGSVVRIPFVRRPAKWMLRRYAEWLSGSRIPDLNSGLRVMRRSTVERFRAILPDTFSFTSTITIAMLANRLEVAYVPIDYFERSGTSKIRPVRDTLRFFQLVFRSAMYFRPLKAFLPLALLFGVAFLASLGWDVFVERNLTEKTLLLAIGATQVAMFALLADMIAKRLT